MGSVPLQVPSASIPPLVGPAGLIGTVGMTSDLKFPIKVYRFRPRYFTPLSDVTGDGDTVGESCWTNNGILYADIVIYGYAIAPTDGSAIDILGVDNLVSAGVVEGFFFNMSATLKHTMTVRFESIIPDWSRSQGAMPMIMTGKKTEAASMPGAVESDIP